jgi:PKHD-type hydroxylase
MSYNIPKYGKPLECFAIWQGGFSSEEIDKIIDIEKLQEFDRGRVGNDLNVAAPNEVRNADITWIHTDQHSDWVFNRIASITSLVNHDHFMYNIDGVDALQYSKYGPDQHYTWHWDVEFGWRKWIRKISIAIMLSDPSEYEGGEFQLIKNGNLDDMVSIKLEKGDMIYFASWMPHRVAPVTSGLRRSLVAWVMGEREC